MVGYSSGYPSRFEDDGFLIGSGLVDSEVGEEPQSICALLLADVAIGHGWEFWAIGVSLSFLPLSSLLLDVAHPCLLKFFLSFIDQQSPVSRIFGLLFSGLPVDVAALQT